MGAHLVTCANSMIYSCNNSENRFTYEIHSLFFVGEFHSIRWIAISKIVPIGKQSKK
jgi:hypothetical protein